MSNVQKEVKKLVKAAKAQGWRTEERKATWILYDPSGDHIETVHKTPSPHGGAIDQSVRRMRRFGFRWKGR